MGDSTGLRPGIDRELRPLGDPGSSLWRVEIEGVDGFCSIIAPSAKLAAWRAWISNRMAGYDRGRSYLSWRRGVRVSAREWWPGLGPPPPALGDPAIPSKPEGATACPSR